VRPPQAAASHHHRGAAAAGSYHTSMPRPEVAPHQRHSSAEVGSRFGDPQLSLCAQWHPAAGRRVVALVMRWLIVAATHTLTAVCLVLVLRELFFGRVKDDCTGPALASCADDEGWRSRSYDGAMGEEGKPCSNFVKNASLHELCHAMSSDGGVSAADACQKACGTCGWSPYIELIVAGAPVWARNALLAALLAAGCSRMSGFQNTPGLMRNLLVGPNQAAVLGTGPCKSGWIAIAGVRVGEPGEQPQATWAEACQARALTQRQALSSAAAKLLLWHWSQPVAYLLVLWGYRCYVAALGPIAALDPGQRTLAAVVAAREIVYLASTLLGVCCCPVFLLLDPVAAWREAPTRLEKCIRVAMYVLTPHNYAALCLANRFRGLRRTFLGLVGVQIIADLASCVALGVLMAGGIEEEEKKPPAALKIGYSITAFGFLLFFGPLSVATSLRVAIDQSQKCWRRIASGAAGSLLLLAWTCILLLFVLLSADVDVFCRASKLGILVDPCNGHGKCYAAAQCRCDEGYGPEVSYAEEALCACAGASKSDGCGPHGNCWADTERLPQQQHTCECEAGYSGNLCDLGTGCDGDPCGGSHGTCTPDGGNHTCACNAGWKGESCAEPTGCDASPCYNGGTCTAAGGQYSCHCANGWKGDTCWLPTGCDGMGSVFECGQGQCVANAGDHNCTCTTGWTTVGNLSCAHPTGCDDSPDCGHGHCAAEGGASSCECDSGWASSGNDGEPCNHPTGCDSNPDCGHGSCVANGGEHTCACETGYIGEHCAGAFTVSGSINPHYNGLYNKTADVCHGKPIYSSGDVDMFKVANGSWWMIDYGWSAKSCHSNGYVDSVDGSCPESPDGIGCVGKWLESVANASTVCGDSHDASWCPNSNFTVVAHLM
jgi:hypothetical protein